MYKPTFRRPKSSENNAWNFLKENIELIGQVINNAAKLGVFLSALIFVLYFNHIDFFPTELELSDAFLAFYVVFGFCTVMTLGIFVGFCVFFWLPWIVQFSRKYSSDKVGSKKFFVVSLLACLAIVLSFFFYAYLINNKSNTHLLFGFLLLGLSAVALYILLKEKRAKVPDVIIIAMFFLFVLFVIDDGRRIVELTFQFTSLRQPNATILLSSENYEKIKPALTFSKIKPKDFVDITAGIAILPNVDILWHGVGKNALLRIKDEESCASDRAFYYVDVAISNDALHIIHQHIPSAQKLNQCRRPSQVQVEPKP